jgi:hypothetical protein
MVLPQQVNSNGDVAGVDDKLPGVLDKSWEELGYY